MFKAIPILVAVFLAPPVAAQDVDCVTATAQQELNQCAHASWKAADRALNVAYSQAMALLKSWDSNVQEAERGAAEALRAAQRAWITFRDTACAAEGLPCGAAAPSRFWSMAACDSLRWNARRI